MQRIQATVAGPLFWIGTGILATFALRLLITVWKKFFRDSRTYEETENANAGIPAPSWTTPVTLTTLIVGGFVLSFTLVWNSMQSVTTNASTYNSKAETDYRQQVTLSNLPNNEQLDQNKTDLKNRAEVQPHQKALNDFDAHMKAEADKIRQRSLGGTNKSNVEKR